MKAKASHYLASFNTPDLTYTPALNYNGPDSFTFKARDGQVDSNIATININILNISKKATITTLDTSPNPSYYGKAVTFSARVAGLSGTTTGIVTYRDENSILGTANLNRSGAGNVTLWDGNKKLGTSDLDSSDRATFSISTLSKVNHSIMVKYGGDGDYNDSISQTLIQVVNQK